MLTQRIRELAEENGIDVLEFADASEFGNYPMADSARKCPERSLPQAKSIIVAGIYIGGLALPAWDDPHYGRTSRLYLSGYFLDAAEPLEPIASFLREQGYKAIICDESQNATSVLPLKLAAVRCGIGWQGKNSLLVTRKYGSYLALGGIITDAFIERSEAKETDHCGKCDRCIKSCPMNALDSPYILNRQRCLSFQLQDSELSDKAARVSGNRVADCEICQDVCPWNRKHRENPLQTKLTISFQEQADELSSFYSLSNLANLTEDEYLKETERLHTDIPFAIFKRNVKIAIGGMTV
ncbi:MAG TPA: 4Fe-4S double cluster binding domain-containing protein [Bacteroidales bacterium]|nr:4Fe-4S double cluster binding domain-containing protein [Bacteroidales bacterium]